MKCKALFYRKNKKSIYKMSAVFPSMLTIKFTKSGVTLAYYTSENSEQSLQFLLVDTVKLRLFSNSQGKTLIKLHRCPD